MGAEALSTHLWSLVVTCARAFQILRLREPRFMTAGPNEKPGQGEMKGRRWNNTTGGRRKASLKSSLSIDLPGWVEQTTKLTKQVSRSRSRERWISLYGLWSSREELWIFFFFFDVVQVYCTWKQCTSSQIHLLMFNNKRRKASSLLCVYFLYL